MLAPDIRDSFGVSDGVIVFVSAASGAFIVLGALPMGWLADRYRRPPIIAAAAVIFSVFVFLSGLAVNAFTLFLARLGVGVAKSSNTTVHPSLVADAYPIGVRGRLERHQPGQRPADRRHQPGAGRRHRHAWRVGPTAGAGRSSSSASRPSSSRSSRCASPSRPGASSR